MSNTKESALRGAGYQPSSYEADKWVNTTSGHWVKRDGDSTIFSTSRHNTYGAGMSQKDFSDRLKK